MRTWYCATMWTTVLSIAGTMTSEVEASAEASDKDPLWVYVGTYTRSGGSEGIYQLVLDLQTGELSLVGLAGQAVNPSFLAIRPGGRFLYAVTEVGGEGGKPSGAVGAFAIDPRTGSLSPVGQGQLSGGAGPCHVATDPQGRWVLAANYGGGSVCALPIRPDGSLGPATAVVQHEGSSVDPRRQKGPHAHSINLDPAGRFAFAADLGLDKVLIYRFDNERGTLQANDPAWAALAPASGPRHFAFHPSGQYAYVINEMTSTLTAFAYDASAGSLRTLQTLSTLPEGFEGNNSTAEVQVHPSGRFVYGSNRGHDSIAIFAIDAETGQLTARGHQSTAGKTPRNFGIDPTGKFLLAANQGTNTVVAFRIDQASGALQPTGQHVSVPSPVCVKMMRPPASAGP